MLSVLDATRTVARPVSARSRHASWACSYSPRCPYTPLISVKGSTGSKILRSAPPGMKTMQRERLLAHVRRPRQKDEESFKVSSHHLLITLLSTPSGREHTHEHRLLEVTNGVIKTPAHLNVDFSSRQNMGSLLEIHRRGGPEPCLGSGSFLGRYRRRCR